MNEQKQSQTPNNSLIRDWEVAVEQLFDYAKESDEQEFISALKPPIVPIKFDLPNLDKTIPYLDDYMDQELSEAIDTYAILARSAQNTEFEKKTRIKLMLIIFLCLLEADTWHSILENLLRIITGMNYKNNLRNKVLESKRIRIVLLFGECKKKGVNLSIQQLYKDICNKNIIDLRNAFFHSQYILSPQGDWLIMTKDLLKNIPTSKSGKKKGKIRKTGYSFNEVKKMYDNIVVFVKALALKRKEALLAVQAGKADESRIG